MKWWMALLGVLIGWGGVMASPILIQESVRNPGQPTIPFSLYRLDNGLNVIIHPDARRPIVHVEMIYRVGSSHEDVGKSGFAHLFEHMMFQGSKHVPANEHMKIIDEIGGKLNGATGRDLTFFYQTVPAHHLETALWLESDRMGYFLEGLNQEKFDIQRNVVKSERFQRYENQPYGLVYETISTQLYPHPHPYNWLPIGHIEDLDRASIDDVRHFFKTWYTPNNATLIIAGDVDPITTIETVNRYFGDIPSGSPVPVRLSPQLELTQSIIMVTEDPKVTVPKLWIVCPTIPAFHSDEPYLDALAHVLSFGASSRFYPLIKQKKALSVEAYHITAALSGEFYIEITPHDGVNMNDLVRSVEEVVDGIQTTPIDEAELTRFKRRYDMRMADTFQELGSVARLLGTYYYLTGTPHYYPIEKALHAHLTTANMAVMLQRYWVNKPRMYVGVNPTGRPDILPFVMPPMSGVLPVPGMLPLGMMPSVNRSQRPAVGQGVTPSMAPIWKVTQHDVIVTGQTVDGEPLVSIRMGFKGGQGLATQLGYEAGSAMALVRLLNQDTTSHTAEALAAHLDSLGASVSIDAGTDEILVTIRCLKSVLAEVMPVVFERLVSPAMNADDLARIRDEMAKELRLISSDPDQIASMAMAQMVYGVGHPVGQSMLGVSSRLPSITVESLSALRALLLNREQLTLVVAGGITTADMGVFDPIQLLPKQGPTLNTTLVRSSPSMSIVVINIPDLPQSEVRVGFSGPAWDGLGDFLKLQWLNLPIGGLFNSRINLRLREEKGMTYGANSYWLANRYPGHFEVSTSVKRDMTGSAIRDILSIMSAVGELGVTETELAMIQSSMKDRDALRVETLDQQVALLHRMASYGLPDDYLKLRQGLLKSLTRRELVELAQRYMTQNRVVVVVGDYQKMASELASLGMEVVVKGVGEVFP